MIDRVSSRKNKPGVRKRWGTGHLVCALCAGPGSGPVAEHHLTHGVSVFLCEAHRHDGYQRRRGGRDFADELAGMWGASGNLTPRHRRALSAHLRRAVRTNVAVGPLPGSYSWPVLRAEAERRFAAGEPPRRVIYELRTRHTGGDAIVPSVRTMRRWFCEARWLALPAPARGSAAAPTQQSEHRRVMSLAEIREFVVGEPYFNWAIWGSPRRLPRKSSGP